VSIEESVHGGSLGVSAPNVGATRTIASPGSSGGVLKGTLGLEGDPSAVLSSLYRDNTAGWALTVIEPLTRSDRTPGIHQRFGARRSEGTFTADLLSILLFKHGFVDTRLEIDRGMVIASAMRGEAPPPTDRPLRLSVVMPVYNERATFQKVFEELLSKSIPETDIEIVIVESNSTDGTRADVLTFADEPRVTVILESEAKGKGHAVRAGLRAASGDIILIQDADSEYDMDDYEKLLEPLRSFEASFVLGLRNGHDGHWGMRHFEREQLASWVMNVGHLAFLGLFNATYRQRLSDPFTMYKVFRRDCIADVHLECNRFDFDWELTAKLIRRGHVPLELPVNYRSRSFSEGKKITMIGDPVSWVRACFKYRFAPIYDEQRSD
jgi:Glycosyl transferase family 2